jgi:hypothetical protein
VAERGVAAEREDEHRQDVAHPLAVAHLGRGRVVALHHHASTSYQVR